MEETQQTPRTQQHPALIRPEPTAAQAEQIRTIREVLSGAIRAIQAYTPGCAEQTLAIRKIEEADCWVTKAVIHNGQRYL